MELQPIDINQIAPYVYIGFGDDPDLIHKYHTIGGTLEKCAQSNIKNIIESIRVFQLRGYAVVKDEKPIGFTVLADGFLYSFGINGNERSKDNVLAWFELVKEELKYKFKAVLWDKNTRAIDFLKRNGMAVYKQAYQATFLLYKK